MAERYLSSSAKETEQIAGQLAQKAEPNMVIAFFGSMGMGKTAFTRGFIAGLGGDDVVSSPTFALVHEYDTPRFRVFHFDMYRVTTWDDLYSTGFFDYLESGGILLIEWSENIEGALPDTAIRVALSPGEAENERWITIERS